MSLWIQCPFVESLSRQGLWMEVVESPLLPLPLTCFGKLGIPSSSWIFIFLGEDEPVALVWLFCWEEQVKANMYVNAFRRVKSFICLLMEDAKRPATTQGRPIRTSFNHNLALSTGFHTWLPHPHQSICAFQLRPVGLGFHKRGIKQTTPNPPSVTDNKSKALGNSSFFQPNY